MSDTKRPLGCLGLIAVALVVGSITLIFYRVTEVIGSHETARSDRDDPVAPEFITINSQLEIAKAQGRKVTHIILEGAAQPLIGQWSIDVVGDEVVVLAGESGVLTVRIDVIVGMQTGQKELKMPVVPRASTEGVTVEPQLEK